MFEEIMDSVFVAVPLLLVLVLAIVAVIIFLAYTRRVGPFYWVGAYKVPYVFTYEEGRGVPVPGGDSFRKTEDGNTIYFESKVFGDRFVANHLMDLLEYKQGGRLRKKETAQVLTIMRVTRGLWTRPTIIIETKPDGTTSVKMTPNVQDFQNSTAALAIMDAGNKAYLGENFWDKWAPLISALMLGVLFLLALVVVTQFTTASFNQHIAAMNGNTDALIRLVNATTHCNPTPTPRPPLG